MAESSIVVGEDAGRAPAWPRRELVRLERVGKTFANGVVALRGLDLAIGEHEFLSLLGPSGCGKSTALRLIAGLGEVSSGRIVWAPGAGARHADRRDIGFVFQEPTLMPWATVWGNVHLPLRLERVARREARPKVEAALAMVGLTGFEGAYPRELFAALDEITRFRLNDDLLRLWQTQSWTVVFVTHSVYESVYLSNRIAVMAPRPGRVVGEIEVGAPYPRSEAFRTSQPYNDTCRRVSAKLHEAMA